MTPTTARRARRSSSRVTPTAGKTIDVGLVVLRRDVPHEHVELAGDEPDVLLPRDRHVLAAREGHLHGRNDRRGPEVRDDHLSAKHVPLSFSPSPILHRIAAAVSSFRGATHRAIRSRNLDIAPLRSHCMDLYVLRHGKAERAAPGGDDAARPLTEKGQRDARRLGRWMRDHDLAIDLVATSPLRPGAGDGSPGAPGGGHAAPARDLGRARPGGTVDGVLARLAAFDPAGAVLVVGHEPLLSTLASAAIGGGRIRLAKGALAKVGVRAGASGTPRRRWCAELARDTRFDSAGFVRKRRATGAGASSRNNGTVAEGDPRKAKIGSYRAREWRRDPDVLRFIPAYAGNSPVYPKISRVHGYSRVSGELPSRPGNGEGRRFIPA